CACVDRDPRYVVAITEPRHMSSILSPRHLPRTGLASRAPRTASACRLDVDRLHHALVLVFGDVAVEDEPADDDGIGERDLDLGGRWLVSDLRRNRDGVDQAVHRLRDAVDLGDRARRVTRRCALTTMTERAYPSAKPWKEVI